jgi:hypothetical protein
MSTEDPGMESVARFSVVSMVSGAFVDDSMLHWKPANVMGKSDSTAAIWRAVTRSLT